MMRARKNENHVLRHPEAGFSLVEVMAALAILTIALTAVFATFISQQKSFTVQNRVAEMQQNLRQAVEYLSRDIRMAGYGIPDNVTIPSTATPAGITSVRALYAQDNTTGSDKIYILYMFDMDANRPPTTITALVSDHSTSTVFPVASTSGFSPMDLFLITNGVAADLFQIDNGTTVASPIPHSQGNYNTAGHATFPGGGYAAGSVLAKARFARYYIDSTTDPAHPTLMVDRMGGALAQPVADDIEDMQLTYGLDTGGDGIVDNWTPSPTTPSQIRQVRLQLVARSRLPEAGWSETRPSIGNHAAGTAPDGYRRRIYDIVIDVRNSGA
jgi:type IV pilus assembly protein PilW